MNIEFLRPFSPRGHPFFPDPNLKWLGDVVRPWDGVGRMWLAIFGLPFDGATVSFRRGSRHAPSQIREALYSRTVYSSEHDSEVSGGIYDCGDLVVDITDYDETMRRLSLVAPRVFRGAEHVLSIGGDHSLTYGLVRAARSAAGREIGLIQFDAHHDNREPWARHSGFWLRKLMEEGVVKGGDVYQIGIRGSLYSPYYRRQLEERGVRVVTVWELRERGTKWVLQDVANHFSGERPLYITFDVDVVDQAEAPGTDSPSPGGLTSWEAIYLVYGLAASLNVRWLDLMEVSPPYDVGGQTVRLAAELAAQFIHARNLRKG